MSTVKALKEMQETGKRVVSWEEITLHVVVGLPKKSVQYMFHKLYYNVQ